MTILSSISRNDYTGNGVQTVFAYTFKIFDATHVKVLLNGSLQTLNTHYTVSGVGVSGGGNITFVTAPGSGMKVAIIRNAPYTQDTDYVDNDPFPAETHEAALDKLEIQIQQVKAIGDRSLVLPEQTTGVSTEIPDPNVVGNRGLVLRIKSDGTGFDAVAVGTGTILNVLTTKGDIIGYDSAPVRIPIGLDGEFLMALAADAQGLLYSKASTVLLTNKTGGSLAAGDIGAIDTANDSAVALVDVQGSTREFVVALETIANNVVGRFARGFGLATINSTGAIARGQWVRKSATTKVVEDAGVAITSPAPAGAVGFSVSAAAGGQVLVMLLGSTVPLAWSDVVLRTLVDAKGDLFVGTADNTLARKAVGANKSLLQADSAQADGLVWIAQNVLPGADYWEYAEIADPATPAADKARSFAKDVGGTTLLAYTAPSGTVTQVGGTLDRDVTTHNVVNDAAETTVYTFTVKGGTLGTHRAIRLSLIGDFLNDTGANQTLTVKAKYGATTISDSGAFSFATSTNRRQVLYEVELSANNATNAQVAKARVAFGNGTATQGLMTGVNQEGVSVHNAVAEDSTVDKTLAVTFQLGAANANLSARALTVQVQYL